MLLEGKKLSELMQQQLILQREECFGEKKHYLAILFFGENPSSNIYVRNKVRYGTTIGVPTLVFWQGKQGDSSDFSYLTSRREKNYQRKEEILELIHYLNQDENCVGIIIQLPLPASLEQDKQELLSHICPEKDVDGLGGTLVWWSFFDYLDFIPATPKAVFMLLDHYQLWDLSQKEVVILWQSTIVGKPLALECIKRGAKLQCFTAEDNPELVEQCTRNADYLFSATGQAQLIGEKHINPKGTQIIVDIGYAHIKGKAVGDVDFLAVKDRVAHITPVPGGIGPLTICALFSNIFSLWKQKEKIHQLSPFT